MDKERCRKVGEELVELTRKVAVEEWSDEELADGVKKFFEGKGIFYDELLFLRRKLPLWWNGWGSPEKVR